MIDRIGDWLQTRNGVRFFPLDPREDEILIEDIAFALAHTNRFNGHVGVYSVAEHSCRVSKLLLEKCDAGTGLQLALAGLLHDAAECYVADVPRPVKMCLRAAGDTAYDAAEFLVMSAVERRFGVPSGLCSCPAVKEADAVMLATERRDLFPNPLEWNALPDPIEERISPWCPEKAEQNFLSVFRMLTENDGD